MQTQKHIIDRRFSLLLILLTLLIPLVLSNATVYVTDDIETEPYIGAVWTTIIDVVAINGTYHGFSHSAATNTSIGALVWTPETFPENLTYTAYARITSPNVSSTGIYLGIIDDTLIGITNHNSTADTNHDQWMIRNDAVYYNTGLTIDTTLWYKLEIYYDNSTSTIQCRINNHAYRTFHIQNAVATLADFYEYGTTAYLDDINIESNPPPADYGSPLATLGMWLIPGMAVLAMLILIWKLKDEEGSIVHKTMVLGISLLLIAVLVPIALNLLG